MQSIRTLTGDQLEKAFQLAYFLFPDKTIALSLTVAACNLISRIPKVQHGPKVPEEALLQYAIYLAVEVAEKDEKAFRDLLGPEYKLTRDDFIIRYVMHLIWRTSRMRSGYVAIGLGCFLYRYTPTAICELSGGCFDSSNIRRVKSKIVKWLRERFEHTGIIGQVVGDIKVAPPGSPEYSLVQQSLKHFTPWGSNQLQALGKENLFDILFDSNSNLPDWLRTCALIDTDHAGIEFLIREYNKPLKKARLADPSMMLAIPAFEGQPTDDPNRRISPPALLDSEMFLLKRVVDGNQFRQNLIDDSSELYEELYDYLTGYRSERQDDLIDVRMSDDLRNLVCGVVSEAFSTWTRFIMQGDAFDGDAPGSWANPVIEENRRQKNNSWLAIDFGSSAVNNFLLAKVEKLLFNPTIAIDFGGTGNQVVRRLKQLVHDHYDNTPTLLNFLVVDADEDKFNNQRWVPFPALTGLGQVPLYDPQVPFSDVCDNLGAYLEIQDWLLSAVDVSLLDRQDGADQIRMLGCIAFHKSFAFFEHCNDHFFDQYQKIQNRLEAMQRCGFNVETDLFVYVASSICGGTGAGEFIDEAMVLRALASNSFLAQIIPGITLVGRNFAGWYLLNGRTETIPSLNFGTAANAGIDLRRATQLTFYARGKNDGECVEFFMGGVGRDSFTREPNAPFPDSILWIPRIITVIDLIQYWSKYPIDISRDGLSYVLGGFGWVTSAVNNPNRAIFWVDDIQFDNALAIAAFLVNGEASNCLNIPVHLVVNPFYTNGGFEGSASPWVLSGQAFWANGGGGAYSGACYLSSGRTTPANGAAYHQVTVPAGGRQNVRFYLNTVTNETTTSAVKDRLFVEVRDANGVLLSTLATFSSLDRTSPGVFVKKGPFSLAAFAGCVIRVQFRTPGWSDKQTKLWSEDQLKMSTHTGNMAWAMLGLLGFFKSAGDDVYLNAAARMSEWIEQNCRDEKRPGGYTSGFDGFDGNTRKLTYKATEHNIDLYTAFRQLFLFTGIPVWMERAEHARKFVAAMWHNTEGKFYTGTGADGTIIYKDVILVDIQSSSILTLDPDSEPHWRGLQYPETHPKVDCNYDFNQNRDCIWNEGTGQRAVAYLYTCQRTQGRGILSVLKSRHLPPGSMFASEKDRMTTGFTLNDGQPYRYFQRIRVGAIGWCAQGELGVNPFWGTLGPYQRLESLSSGSQKEPSIAVAHFSGFQLAGSDYFVVPSLWPTKLKHFIREETKTMKEPTEGSQNYGEIINHTDIRAQAISCLGRYSGKTFAFCDSQHPSQDRLNPPPLGREGMEAIGCGMNSLAQRRKNLTTDPSHLKVRVDGKERMQFDPEESSCRPFRISLDSLFIEVCAEDDHGDVVLAAFLVPDPDHLETDDAYEDSVTTEAGQVVGCYISPILSKARIPIGCRAQITWKKSTRRGVPACEQEYVQCFTSEGETNCEDNFDACVEGCL